MRLVCTPLCVHECVPTIVRPSWRGAPEPAASTQMSRGNSSRATVQGAGKAEDAARLLLGVAGAVGLALRLDVLGAGLVASVYPGHPKTHC